MRRIVAHHVFQGQQKLVLRAGEALMGDREGVLRLLCIAFSRSLAVRTTVG